MPFLIPVVAAGVGFGGGFLASDGLDKFVKAGAVAAVGYLIYQQYQKA